MIDDLILLDRETVQVHLLEGLDLAVSDQTAQLSHGNPSLGLLASTALTLTAALTFTLTESLSESALSLGSFCH